MRRIRCIDSHTGGEPTRVVVEGGPDLGKGSLAERRERFRLEHDAFRRSVALEPRGSDVLVGALLVEPQDASCAAGVIFFNNVGYLGMCGHGAMGVAATLGHLGRIAAGKHRLETPVGVVPFEYDGRNATALENVPSRRHQAGVRVPLMDATDGKMDRVGEAVGDVAWGGNWFFLVHGHGQVLRRENAARLSAYAERVKAGLRERGVTGADGGEIDHVELCGPAEDPANHGRNFVLCPGGAYDRSPCGTGTSAKIACLAADGKLLPGQLWKQESILGSVFTGSFRYEGSRLIPRISGEAYVTAETTLLFDPNDPFPAGF